MNMKRTETREVKDATMPTVRSGIRFRGARVSVDVRRPYLRFLRWLRTHYEFPIRVPVYLFPSSYIITQDGGEVNGSFVAPFDRSEEPLIRVAAGGLQKQICEFGRVSAIGTRLCTVAHECVHYWQWIEAGDVWERGVRVKTRSIVDRYYEDSERWFG